MNANRTSLTNGRAACTLAVLVLVSTVGSVAQNNAEDPRAVLQRGVDLLREGRHEEALLALEDAKRALPGRAQIDNLLGIALTKLGRVPEANEHFRGAIALNPKLAEAHKNLGFNYWTAGRNEEAEKSFQAALQLDPNDEFAHYGIGTVLLATARDNEAILHLQKATSLVERDPPVLLSLASAYFRVGSTNQGLAALAAVEARTDWAPAQEYELAVLLSSRAQYERALPHFRNLERANPSPNNRRNLAVALMNARQFGEAAELLEAAAKAQTADPAIVGLLAAAYEHLGNLPRALENYERAVRLDPGNQDRYLDYTRLLMDLDRYDDSIQVVREGLQKAQDSYALHLRLGATELMKGSPEKAEISFREAIAQHPEIPMGYVALAKALMKTGRASEAATLLQETRQKLPPDFLLEYYYGLALEKFDRDRESAEAFSRANELNPNVPEAHFRCGKLMLKLGQAQDAKRELERTIALHPQHAGAHFQLSRVYAKLGDPANAKKFAAKAAELNRQQAKASLEPPEQVLLTFQPGSRGADRSTTKQSGP